MAGAEFTAAGLAGGGGGAGGVESARNDDPADVGAGIFAPVSAGDDATPRAN